MRRPSIGELRRLNLIMGSKLKLMSDYPDAESIMFSLSPPPPQSLTSTYFCLCDSGRISSGRGPVIAGLQHQKSNESIPREWRRATVAPSGLREQTISIDGLGSSNMLENEGVPSDWRRASMVTLGRNVAENPPTEWAAQSESADSKSRVHSLQGDELKSAMEDVGSRMGFQVPDSWASTALGEAERK